MLQRDILLEAARVILLQVVVSGLLMGSVYALFSSGLTLIWGMMNVVNFAHGDFVMLAMYAAFVVWTVFGGGPAASMPVAALVLATIGVLSYFLLVRHVMRGPMLAQILGTFGLALLLRYSAFWYFGANFKTLPDNILGAPIIVFGRLRRCREEQRGHQHLWLGWGRDVAGLRGGAQGQGLVPQELHQGRGGQGGAVPILLAEPLIHALLRSLAGRRVVGMSEHVEKNENAGH